MGSKVMFYVFHWQNITPSDADIYINCQKYKEIQRYIPKNTINTSKSISENEQQRAAESMLEQLLQDFSQAVERVMWETPKLHIC